MACSFCYNDYISCGVSTIVFNSGVEAVSEYEVIITAPDGATYKSIVSSDPFGDITLNIENYPIGLFNPYAGTFTLHINLTGCNDFLFCDYYKYLSFEVNYGNEEKNTLTCCPPGGDIPTPMTACCTTTTVPFANESVTVVPYSGTRPTIEVAYLNPDNVTYTLGSMGITTLVTFNATDFTIDHGGVSTGIIKLLK